MKKKQFDFESLKADAISKLKAGEGLTGQGGAFTPLLKSFLEEALKGEVEEHIRSNEEPNRKNGKTRKCTLSSLPAKLST